MRKFLFLFFIVFTFLNKINAQHSGHSELQQIETVVNWYFEGWGTGDTAKIGKAMHSTCHLKFFRDGKFTDITRADYLSRFKPRTKPDSLITRIVAIDITGNIANVKTEIITATAIFTDYFNMIKIDEQWFIVDKISTSRPKEKY